MLDLNRPIKVDHLDGIWSLDVESTLGKEYILDQNFAVENRKLMIKRIHTQMQMLLTLLLMLQDV